MQKEWQKAKDVLKNGGIACIPTDTLYGIVARADDKKAVARVYKVKGRDDGKPCIILITQLSDLVKFGVKINNEQKEFLNKNWPNKISVILPVPMAKYAYLHRGTKSIAFRMIGQRNKNLFTLIKSVGPLIAPSANPQGLPPAKLRSEARKYFKDTIDTYVCDGMRDTKPSTLVSLLETKPKILRQGAVKIK